MTHRRKDPRRLAPARLRRVRERSGRERPGASSPGVIHALKPLRPVQASRLIPSACRSTFCLTTTGTQPTTPASLVDCSASQASRSCGAINDPSRAQLREGPGRPFGLHRIDTNACLRLSRKSRSATFSSFRELRAQRRKAGADPSGDHRALRHSPQQGWRERIYADSHLRLRARLRLSPAAIRQLHPRPVVPGRHSTRSAARVQHVDRSMESCVYGARAWSGTPWPAVTWDAPPVLADESKSRDTSGQLLIPVSLQYLQGTPLKRRARFPLLHWST